MVLKSCSSIPIAIYLVGVPLALAKHPDKSVKAEVRLLADSTIIRSSYGANEDVFLVELPLERDESEVVLARLIDRYPPSGAPISPEVLTTEQPITLQVHRDRRCDVAYRDMVLRTRPGDPFALLPKKLVFEPALSPPVDPTSVLPCHRIIHKQQQINSPAVVEYDE